MFGSKKLFRDLADRVLILELARVKAEEKAQGLAQKLDALQTAYDELFDIAVNELGYAAVCTYNTFSAWPKSPRRIAKTQPAATPIRVKPAKKTRP
jgi:hypothetical protein